MCISIVMYNSQVLTNLSNFSNKALKEFSLKKCHQAKYSLNHPIRNVYHQFSSHS